ncbi:MAG: hypothetical protein Q9165_005505 [Trypethelium subeluteriae]
MASDAHRQLAAGAEHDFYALLGVPSDADERTIKREYRKSSLKYHPDQNPDDPDAATKFQLLSDARDILLDSTLRAVYDNARRAQEQKQRQHELLDSRRRQMKEDLENREKGFKRKQEEELITEAKIRRMREEGERRRKELNARRMKEATEAAIQTPQEAGVAQAIKPTVSASSVASTLNSTDPDSTRDYMRRTLDRLRVMQRKRDLEAQQVTN